MHQISKIYVLINQTEYEILEKPPEAVSEIGISWRSTPSDDPLPGILYYCHMLGGGW